MFLDLKLGSETEGEFRKLVILKIKVYTVCAWNDSINTSIFL